MRKSALVIAAGGLATASMVVIPEAEARPWGWGGGWGHRVGWGGGFARPWRGSWGYGGWGYRRGWGWGGGGALAAGIAGAAIGGLIASSYAYPAYAYPAYGDGYPGYYPSYAYGYPVYGYGYGYGYGYPAQTVQYVETSPVVVRRRVVYAEPAYRRRVVVGRAYRYGPAVAVYRPRAQFYRPARYRQIVLYDGRPVRGRAVRVY